MFDRYLDTGPNRERLWCATDFCKVPECEREILSDCSLVMFACSLFAKICGALDLYRDGYSVTTGSVGTPTWYHGQTLSLSVIRWEARCTMGITLDPIPCCSFTHAEKTSGTSRCTPGTGAYCVLQPCESRHWPSRRRDE